MPACFDPTFTHPHQKRTIHLQADNGSASNRGTSGDGCATLNPLKMVMPILPSRIKQRNLLGSLRISSGLGFLLAAIAIAAGQTQVIQRRSAADGFRHNMVDLECVACNLALRLAVFAAVFRPLLDLAA